MEVIYDDTQNHNWFKNILKWIKMIEKNNYSWSIKGYNDNRLGAICLFTRILKIFENYYRFDKKRIQKKIYNYKKPSNLFYNVMGLEEKILENRLALSSLLELNTKIKKINMTRIIKIDSNKFKNSKLWIKPQNIMMDFINYLFLCIIQKKDSEINNLFKLLDSKKKKTSWYHGKEDNRIYVNIYSKILYCYKITNKKLDETFLITIFNETYEKLLNLLNIKKTNRNDLFDDSDLSDYLQVLDYCMKNINDWELKTDIIATELENIYYKIFNDLITKQCCDGGFGWKTKNKLLYCNMEIIPNNEIISNILQTESIVNNLSFIMPYLPRKKLNLKQLKYYL